MVTHTRPLFGIAPDGACLASDVAIAAVGSYSTVSPLPSKLGGLFSVALSVGLPRLGVTQHHALMESGLSSMQVAPHRGHPILRVASG